MLTSIRLRARGSHERSSSASTKLGLPAVSLLARGVPYFSMVQDKLPHTDQYVLRWETKELLAVGKSVEVGAGML